MTLEVCDRASECINFWLANRPVCNECDISITMNHFHQTVHQYRICHNCFEANLKAIEAGCYRPKTSIAGELRACQRYEQCFREQPYNLYKPKTCDGCGMFAPPEHYHDIQRNIRLCLPCYINGREPGWS